MTWRERQAIVAALLLVAAVQSYGQPAIVFTNVTVVDVAAGALRPDQTVVVQGGRIAEAGRAVRVAAGARVVVSKGKFLIPGLWDMHVHELGSPHVLELFLANGVTGVRDMYDDPEKLRALRSGLRVVHQNNTLKGDVRNAEQARAAVRKQLEAGANFIKVYNEIPREGYYAVADECRRLKVPFVGHTPDAITTTEAAAAGQRSIEHLDGVLLDSSWDTKSLRAGKRFLPNRVMLNTFDAGRARRLFSDYVKYGTWHCPTLCIFRSAVLMDDPKAALQDPLLRSVPKEWLPTAKKDLFSDMAFDRDVQRKMMEIVAMMHKAGVRLLAGTDTGIPFILPGYGLHDELELMAAAGIAAGDVLRIATLGPAQFLDREKDLGTVSKGKLADLVLLDADPLQSIANTRKINAVVANGVLYDRVALDRLLAAAKP